MKKSTPFNIFILFVILSSLSSCEAAAGIFKAGIGTGLFLVLAIVAIIYFIIVREGKHKNS